MAGRADPTARGLRRIAGTGGSGRRTLATSLAVALVAIGCSARQPEPTQATAFPTIAQPTAALPSEPPPSDTPPPPTPEPNPTLTATAAPTVVPTATATPEPTATAFPAGYVAVPDVIGLPYRDARNAVLRAGLNFVYRDVLDLDLDTGTVLAQDPVPGTGRPRDSLVFLYRTFKAPPAIVGDICYPLRLISTSGKLLFWVDLEQDIEYEIRTGFPYGETQISDTQMFLLASFENSKKDSMLFTASFTARYVLSLGPYSISQEKLDQNPGGVDAGCLWVIPQEG